MQYSQIYSQKKAIQALLLLVPAASLGVAMATYISPEIIGKTCFTFTKIWLVAFPFIWRLSVEKKAIKIPKITTKEINYGLVLGLVMSAIIIATYWFIGKEYLDIEQVRQQATAVGITTVSVYFLGVMYWSFINSFIRSICCWGDLVSLL